MRIAYVCADPGIPVFGRKGASVHVQGVVAAMRRAGHDVHLFAARLGDDVPLWAAGVRLHTIPGAASESAGSGGALVRALGDVIAAEGAFDLIYERHALWSDAAMLFSNAARTPSVLEVNAPLIEEHLRHRGQIDAARATQIAHRAMARAGLVVTVSEEVASYARRLGADAGRIVVEPNGIDPTRFPDAAPRADRAFTLGFLGTLKPWHGLTALAEIFVAVRHVLPTARLLVVGDGPERDSLASSLECSGVGDACTWSGAVAPDEVGQWLALMDVGLAPYPADAPFYFSPLKVVEYMAAGLPVVASHVGQLPQLVTHGETGVLVPAGDVAAFADACLHLHSSPSLRSSMAAAGRQAVMQTRTWDAVLQRILERALPSAISGGVAA